MHIPVEAFIQVSQEGSSIDSIIAMIHSFAEHNKQLFLMCVRSEFSAAVHSWDFFFNLLLKVEVGYEDVPVFSFLALPFLAACHTENRCWSSRVIHLVWCVDVGEASL